MENTFFEKLSTQNPSFHSALYFCPKANRETIAALILLYTQLSALHLRISEPLAVQMRLTWWREAFEKPLHANLPPEIEILKPYQISSLIEIIENEFVHQNHIFKYTSASKFYTLICEIMGLEKYSAEAAKYGIYYGYLNYPDTQNPIEKPNAFLPLKLKFLRIPIILKSNHSKVGLIYQFIKNFVF